MQNDIFKTINDMWLQSLTSINTVVMYKKTSDTSDLWLKFEKI